MAESEIQIWKCCSVAIEIKAVLKENKTRRNIHNARENDIDSRKNEIYSER
jgi:hypothetical protein